MQQHPPKKNCRLICKSLAGFALCLSVYTLWNNTNTQRKWPDARTSFQREVIGSRLGTDLRSADASETFDPSLAFQKRWVGFPELANITCGPMFNRTTVKNSMYTHKLVRITSKDVTYDGHDCSTFSDKYGFNRYPRVSNDEAKFPIAFIILFNTDIDQVLFLLRSIYRPNNVYCLTADSKSGEELLQAARTMARCVPNVFLSSRLERVVYAGFSRLQADINCMSDLLQHPVTWRYVINMPGQQFPLRTNLEMVKILQKYNGSNDVEGITGRRMLPHRYQYKHVYITDGKTGETSIHRTDERLEPPPHRFEIVKGSAYGTFSRAFVAFVVQDKRAQDLLKWCEFVKSPDEYFWATLHHSKIVPVPGAYTAGEPDKKPWLTVYASWGGIDPCATIRRRAVCIFSPADVPGLLERREFFANKFYITHYPAALHCLDQMLYNLTSSGETRDLSYYDSLPFVTSARGRG